MSRPIFIEEPPYGTFGKNLRDDELLLLPKDTKKPCFAARYVFSIMGMLGMMMAYIMRVCLSIAITQMVISHPDSSSKTNTTVEEYCPDNRLIGNNTNGGRKSNEGEFDWDEETQGVILSAFYYGYILTHVPGGLLAQKFGGKQTFGLGILSTAIFTLLTPLAAHCGVVALVLLRFFEGIGEGTTFPALYTLLARWAPPNERSTLSTISFTGVTVGTIVANLGGGFILEYVPGGWPMVFYIFGSISVVWYIFWCLLCYNDPSSHPFISTEEKLYLQEAIGETERKKDLGPVPWFSILTSAPVWALIFAEIGHDWGLFTMVTDLPKYMSDVIKFTVSENGLLSSLPYFASWIVSLMSSALVDWLLARQYMSCTALRKIFATVGSVGPAIGVICASYVGCDKAAAAALFTLGMGLMGFSYGGIRVNALDLSPNYSGTVIAFVNGFGCLSGMITPYVTGRLTPHRSLTEWRIVFWIMLLVLISTNCVFVIWGSGELQDWNDTSTLRPKRKNKKCVPAPDSALNINRSTSGDMHVSYNSLEKGTSIMQT